MLYLLWLNIIIVSVIAGQMTSVYVLEAREEKRVCPFQKEGRSDHHSVMRVLDVLYIYCVIFVFVFVFVLRNGWPEDKCEKKRVCPFQKGVECREWRMFCVFIVSSSRRM